MNDFFWQLNLFFSSMIIFVYSLFLGLLKQLRVVTVIPDSAVILPPAAFGSLGDEAMVIGGINYLKNKGIKNVSILEYTNNNTYPIEVLENINLRDFLLFQQWYKFAITFIKAGYLINRYERLYCLGADLMDGYYSNYDYATFKTGFFHSQILTAFFYLIFFYFSLNLRLKILF